MDILDSAHGCNLASEVSCAGAFLLMSHTTLCTEYDDCICETAKTVGTNGSYTSEVDCSETDCTVCLGNY